jgi:hypothetical protein
MTLAPERGLVFTQRGTGVVSRLVKFGTRLMGDEGYWSHTGIVGRDGWIWESHIWSGVAYRPWPGGIEGMLEAVRAKRLAFWRPECWTRLSAHDFGRAFMAVRAQWRRPYDLKWIATLGRQQDDDRYICSELSGLYLNVLTEPFGGWPGASLRRMTPDDVARSLSRW